jgi:hypothetical protein
MEKSNHPGGICRQINVEGNIESNHRTASHKRELIERASQKNKAIHRLKTTPGEPPMDQATD